VRLLVVTDLFPPIGFGGYERSCANLVDGLRARHEVMVLTTDLRRETAPPLPWVRRELAYLDRDRRQVLRVPKAAAQAATLTRRLLAEFRPDLVYVASCVVASHTAPRVALEAGSPVVYRLSELWVASSLHWGDQFVGHLANGRGGLHRGWSWLVRGVNHHRALRLDPRRPVPVAVSWCSDDLRARVTLPPGVRPVIERTIYPGVAGPFATLPRRPSDRPTIAYLGRVTTAKGAELAVEALAALRARHGIAAHLVLAGHCSAPMARRLGRLAGSLEIAGSVELAGQLEREPLARLLQRAHAVVIPTVTHEAFGRVCIESALARAPVVAARIGGIPEALRDGEHALLFEPGDVEACASALAAALSDGTSAKARARRAFEHARRFSVERYVDAEEELLEDAVRTLGGRA
jgi:glycosyltransferase involved in cell wall biosynthesis